MKTIEERANNYADRHGFRVPYDGSNNFYDKVDVKASYEGYRSGAIEQHNIDIEKACDIHCSLCTDCGYLSLEKCHNCTERQDIMKLMKGE